MWIPIALVVISLVIMVLAFFGIFGEFPNNWQWVSIILAGVGLAMSSPSILQMFFGRAIIRLEFERYVEGENRALAVELKNPPVKNKILKKLGVKRETMQSIEVQFRIREFGSGRIIENLRSPRIYSPSDSTNLGKDRISLPPTFSVGANFIVISSDIKSNVAFILPDHLNPKTQIIQGYYQAIIDVVIDGEPTIFKRQFMVGATADDLTWSKV